MTPAELIADKVWVLSHFGPCARTPVAANETGTGLENINTYFLPNRYDGFASLISLAQGIGARGLMLTTHYWEGFCLFPSPVSSRKVTNTAWYAANLRDPIADFCTNTRAAGLKVGLYYNMVDYYYDSLGAPGITRTDWALGNLNYLLTHYGNIDMLLLDAWGDVWNNNGGLGYDDIAYAPIYNAIKAAQPNCLVGINDHQVEGQFVSGDFRSWERSGGEVTPEPPQNYVQYSAVVLYDTLHKNYSGDDTARWYSHPDKTPEQLSDISAGVARRFRMLYDGRVWSPNFSVAADGRVDTTTRNMVNELLYVPGAVVNRTTFTSPVSTSLSVWDSRWVQDSPSQSAIVMPGHLRINASGSLAIYRLSTITQSNGRVELEGEITTPFSTYRAAVKINGGSPYYGNAAELTYDENSDGTLIFRLIAYDGSSDSILASAVIDLTKYNLIPGTLTTFKLAVERRGSLLTAEYWAKINGEYQCVEKLYGTSTLRMSGNPAFDLSGFSTDTVGFHLTNFTVLEGRGENLAVADVDSGKLVHYKFDELNGTNCFDSSGNLKDGTISSLVTVAHAAGKKAGALQFTGGNVSVPGLSQNNDVTFSCWVKPTGFAGIGGFNAIYTTVGFPFLCIHWNFKDSGIMDFALGGEGGGGVGTAANWPLNIWTQIAFTFTQSTGVFNAYANGVFVGTLTLPSGFAPDLSPAGLIGDYSGGGRTFSGYIDDFRIFNRILSSAELLLLASVGQNQGSTLPMLGMALTV